MAGILALVGSVDAAPVNDEPKMSAEEVVCKTKVRNDELMLIKSEIVRIPHVIQARKQKIRATSDEIKVNKALPYLVSSIVELLDVDPRELTVEDGASVDLGSERKGKSAVIKSSPCQTDSLPFVGLVHTGELHPGLNKVSFLILETLPQQCDPRVKATEVDDRPTGHSSDIDGLDKQTKELFEAGTIVLPLTHKDKFTNFRVNALKGGLVHSSTGTGKTPLARACGTQARSTFLKPAGSQLGPMFIHEGAKPMRDAFALSKKRAPAVTLIGGLDAISNKRRESEKYGNREVPGTMLELLIGFSSGADMTVITAADQGAIFFPAPLRSDQLDRKVEVEHPDDHARTRIMRIHWCNGEIRQGR